MDPSLSLHLLVAHALIGAWILILCYVHFWYYRRICTHACKAYTRFDELAAALLAWGYAVLFSMYTYKLQDLWTIQFVWGMVVLVPIFAALSSTLWFFAMHVLRRSQYGALLTDAGFIYGATWIIILFIHMMIWSVFFFAYSIYTIITT